MELGGNIIESADGIGLLWFTRQQFQNFILRVVWRASALDDNSGIFIRFPDPGNDLTIPVTPGYEIEANGATNNVRLDGQQVSKLQNANRSPKGFIGLQNHHAGSRVQFTRLRIKELP